MYYNCNTTYEVPYFSHIMVFFFLKKKKGEAQVSSSNILNFRSKLLTANEVIFGFYGEEEKKRKIDSPQYISKI
ncbi:hypothetical protein LguiA_020842 [Lonicera macranthoides]